MVASHPTQFKGPCLQAAARIQGTTRRNRNTGTFDRTKYRGSLQRPAPRGRERCPPLRPPQTNGSGSSDNGVRLSSLSCVFPFPLKSNRPTQNPFLPPESSVTDLASVGGS